ncbi:ImmA/IrrE family metallo-endopeptidase [Erythrobacter sp. GH1-10]|uniref:ImmA/IrrE family metallo-endopeptidase n=1 Tax=Erythrobacter sp. GH1-10 TaxID=3349334 RepID=UPI0038782A02
MKIERLDLDGVGAPRKLAERIHEIETLPLAVPIEELCEALGILSIKEVETSAFEAALITDAVKSAGHILVNRNSPRHRRRFSIAHELGHFLIEAHRTRGDHPIECALQDLHLLNPRDRDKRIRIEGEANTFAADLLMPPRRIREYVGHVGVSLEVLVAMAREFEVSKEAMARAFVASHREPCAVIVSRNGRVERFYRHEDFPYLPVAKGKSLPFDCLATDDLAVGTFTEPEEIEPDIWLSEHDAERVLALTEQALGQSNGFAMTLLQAELDEG